MLLRHSVMNCINHLEGERECYEIESSSDWIPVRGIVISASLGGTCNMMIDMKIAMLTKPSQFCLHGIVYESKYCKSCIGGTCNRRIDMTECNIPSPFVIVLTLWSLLLGPGAVPTDTTLFNNIELAWSENSTVLGDLGKVQAKNTKAKREQGGESRQYCGLSKRDVRPGVFDGSATPGGQPPHGVRLVGCQTAGGKGVVGWLPPQPGWLLGQPGWLSKPEGIFLDDNPLDTLRLKKALEQHLRIGLGFLDKEMVCVSFEVRVLVTQVRVLGHIVSAGWHHYDPSKVKLSPNAETYYGDGREKFSGACWLYTDRVLRNRNGMVSAPDFDLHQVPVVFQIYSVAYKERSYETQINFYKVELKHETEKMDGTSERYEHSIQYQSGQANVVPAEQAQRDDGELWAIVQMSKTALREKVMTEARSSLFTIHPGSTKMYRDLKQYFWWNGMKQEWLRLYPNMTFTGLAYVLRKDMMRFEVVVDRLTNWDNIVLVDLPTIRVGMQHQGNTFELFVMVENGDTYLLEKQAHSSISIGPFEILERIGEVSYRLALPPQLSHVHDVFHVSLLRGYHYHLLHVASYPFDHIQPDMSLSEEPESILDRQERVMRNKVIPFVTILWKNHPDREATWETEESIRVIHNILLQDQGIFNSGCSRHMTGNKSFLTDYQEIDGGFVAFGGSLKGGGLTCLFAKAIIDDLIYGIGGLNRVLITKPHNKTPYELLIGRPPNLDFMRPFGCSVTILNTLDHLGKFEGKADEGFLVGYSVNGKAFKLLQKIKLMGIQVYETKLYDSPQSSKDAVADDAGKKTNEEPANQGERNGQEKEEEASNKEDDQNVQDFRAELDNLLVQQKEGYADSTNRDSTVSPFIPTTRIHKDHPKDQIIRDINSATQTRRITKISEELTMRLVDLLKGKHAIGTKWVYRNKKDERGIVVINKARLVTQGYTQEEGIDYDEVFAPVARIEAIRLFLAYGSFMGLIVYQIDVKSAFLYEKALYGLHQAPRAWYETLSTYLLENGFRRGIIDKTLFIKKDKGDILLVEVYVDDIIFGSTKKSLCTEFESLMHKKFQMSSMRELTFFLGLQVMQRSDGIFISQDKYVADILKKFDFATVKTTSTPIETNKALLKDEEAEDVDVHLYRSMIGSLMYLTASRHDIMFAVCACARFQVTPKVSHLHAVKRVFRNLKVIMLECLDRKSITRSLSISSKRTECMAKEEENVDVTQTTEAEYVAAANCYGQVRILQKSQENGQNRTNTDTGTEMSVQEPA
ncbi:putative ribonuclease H-like domain-containing protein [Tanacetum coccineum]